VQGAVSSERDILNLAMKLTGPDECNSPCKSPTASARSSSFLQPSGHVRLSRTIDSARKIFELENQIVMLSTRISDDKLH
jgi:hypothetical protein